MFQFKLSVVICTHNRAQDLQECLAALSTQLSTECEYLVVDSGSSPEQAALIRQNVAEHPSFKFIRMDQPGLSAARNAALDVAQGQWLALLDDDAVPAPDWTEVALQLVNSISDDYAIVGGQVRPITPSDVQPRLGRRWMQLISAVETPGEGDCTDKPLIVGANMWFRCEPLRSVNGFPSNLGRIGKSLLSGEDKLVVNQLVAQGWRIWYSARLSVGHKIHRERLARPWAIKRAYWDGISDRRIQRMLGEHISLATVLVMALKTVGLTTLYLVQSPEHEYFLRFWFNLGWLRESVLSDAGHGQ